jgi:hypothetical protein
MQCIRNGMMPTDKALNVLLIAPELFLDENHVFNESISDRIMIPCKAAGDSTESAETI